MRIIDLSCDIAGRFGTKLFAMAGDTVLRCAPRADENDALSFYLDGDKQWVEPAELPALLAGCDLVWTSFDQGAYLGHGAGLNVPDGCVHVTTSSYGTTGPYAGWRGGSIADWAAGGYLFITGDPDREPLAGPENLCGYAAGYTAAGGAEAALIDRIRTGRGRHLDISTMESMLLLHQSTFSRANIGEVRQRTGRYREVYPLTVLPCRDGYISVGVVMDAEFDKLAVAIGRPELSIDPRFVDRPGRMQHRDELDRELAPFLESHDADDAVAIIQAGGVASAKAVGSQEIVENPQLAYRGYWKDAAGGGKVPGDPLRPFHPFAKPDTAPPALGPTGDLPLAGVRVLDFTIFWAGPSATRALADLGAEVIWVERPNSRLGANFIDGEPSSAAQVQFHLYDTKMFRGKRSIELNLEKPEDRAVAHDLARQAHIVVENFRPGVANKLGIGPAELARINPALTYVSLSGFGGDGPWANWRSYGPTIEAVSSIEGRTGYLGGQPLRLGHALPDGIGGLVGALAALRGLRRTMAGEAGGWYDISQLEAYVALCGEGIIAATRDGRGPDRIGNRSYTAGVIQGVFACQGADQWIAIRLEGDAERAAFSAAAALSAALPANADMAEPLIAEATRGHDKFALTTLLQAAGIEAFPVLDAAELIADPHLRERGYFVQTAVGERQYSVPGTPIVAVPSMADARGPAPAPGEHSPQVRAEVAAQAGAG